MQKMGEENEVENNAFEAERIYVLMQNEYRISRNIRAQWFLNNLNKEITVKRKIVQADCSEEIEVISAVPRDEQLQNNQLEKRETFEICIVPETKVIFLATRYRLVFCLDLSPSVATVDSQRGSLYLEEILPALRHSLEGISRSFCIPYSKFLFLPQLYVTVIAHVPNSPSDIPQVLIQGWILTPHNLNEMLGIVQKGMKDIAACVAQTSGDASNELGKKSPSAEYTNGSILGSDHDNSKIISTSQNVLTADISTLNLLRYGILALQLLPENSSAGIIVITDGVISFPNAYVQDSLLAQLRNSTIACSFLQTGSPYQPFSCFGRNPYTELMQFISAATYGSYFPSAQETLNGTNEPNAYHEAFLYWTFQTTDMPDFFKEFKPFSFDESYWTVDNPHFYSVSNQSRVRKKHVDGTLKISLENVLSCRLREGYTVKSVTVDEGEHMIKIKLLLPWNLSTNFEYIISSKLSHGNYSVRSLESETLSSRYEFIVDGCYEFLHDVTCSDKKPIKSYYRTAVIKQFWNYVKSLSQTDQVLIQLHSFTMNPAHYTIPDSIKNGVPMSYLSPNSSTPTLSSKSMAHSPFTTFWKPVSMLDINVWQKWMHTHRIGIILQHDTPLAKNLQLPNTSGRYVHIQCRQATYSLNSLLRDYSSFVLVDNHFYIKFLYNDADKPPVSFYIIRVTSKAPCVVIRLAFLGGLPGQQRNEIVKDLRKRICDLKLPKRKSPKDHHSTQHSDASGLSHQVSTYDVNCCFLLKKPVEKILIRYEKVPENFTISIMDSQLSSRRGPVNNQLTEQLATNMLIMLSKYLLHQRWVWSMQSGPSNSLALPIVSKILSVLTRIKLRQGFHFSHSNFGITYMVLEAPMKPASDQPESESYEESKLLPCVVQYLLFPPHTNTTFRDSTSEEEESELPESEGELQLITECWIEPQYGITSLNPCASGLNALSYAEISHAIYKEDWQCISVLTTFEHLNLLCQKKRVESATHPELSHSSTTNDVAQLLADSSAPEVVISSTPLMVQPHAFCINVVPYSFNLMNLLPKCHQTELLFPTLHQYENDSQENDRNPELLTKSNELLFEHLMENLMLLQDKELLLSNEECCNFLLQLHHRVVKDTESPELQYPHFSYYDGKGKHLTSETLLKCDQCSKLKEILQPSHSQECELIPKWRCFLKGCSSSRFIMTFVPASYSDLEKIVCRKTDLKVKEDVCDDSNDNVEHKENTSEGQNVCAGSAGEQENDSFLILPVYTYDCILSLIIDQLINNVKNCYSKDRSESHTFLCQDSSSLSIIQTHEIEVNFDENRRPDAKRYDKSLLKGCHSLMDRAFSKSFVYAVYRSLVLDLPIEKLDVTAAVDEICDESLLEVDITDFFFMICGHIKDFLVKHSVKQQHLASEQSEAGVKESQAIEEQSNDKLQLSFPITLLQRHQPCEQLLQRHLDIKERFCDILQCFLKKIPSRPDYYIFRPAEDSIEESITEDVFNEQNLDDEPPIDSENPAENAMEKDSNSNAGNPEDLLSLNNSMNTQSSLSSLDEDPDSSFSQKKVPSPPLFIHLLYSVKTKDDIKSCSLSTIPTCLNDLQECLSSDCSDIDLEHFKLTLDITCLNLPNDVESPSVVIDRQYSTSFSSSSPIPDASQSQTTRESSNSSDSLSETVQGMFLRDIPQHQRDGVYKCIDKIKWLLMDEKVACALKSYPIAVDTLKMVVDHVQNAKDNMCCIVKEVTLKFVFGAESSVEKFIQVFKRLTLPGFHLNEEENFYYLAINAESTEKQNRSFGSLEPPLGIASQVLMAQQNFHCDDSTQLTAICDEAQKVIRTDEDATNMLFPMHADEDSFRMFRQTHRRYYEEDTETEDGTELALNRSRNPKKSISKASSKIKSCIYSEQAGTVSTRRCHSLPPKLCHSGNYDNKIKHPGEKKLVASRSAGISLDSVFDCSSNKFHKMTPKKLKGHAQRSPSLQQRNFSHNSHPSVSSTRSSTKYKGTEVSNSPQFFSDFEYASLFGSCHFSTTEDGYDGDSSDAGSDWDWMSALDTKRPVLPPFWLIMTVDIAKVTIHFHIRNRKNVDDEELKQSHTVLSQINTVITNICKEVNQTLLLQSLHETRMCNRLLVPEENEDVWKKNEPEIVLGKLHAHKSSLEDGNSVSEVNDKYLEANLNIRPGAFSCNVIWVTHFKLHHRLTHGHTGYKSKGIQAFRTVLDSFSVNNRENMFVYQERSGSVFYLRLYERICDDDHSTPKLKSAEGSFSPGGVCCSGAQNTKKFYPENENEGEFRSRVNSGHSDIDREDSQSTISSSRGIPHCIALFVHGIGEVGREIKDDLVQVLQNRLNDCVLDMIIMLLSRNPLCKLTPEDVQFIQNPNKSPTSQIHFTIPVKLLCYAHSIHMYLRHNLLHFLHNPKYTDSRRENHFKAYSTNTSEWTYVDDNDIFLYYSPQASGYSGSKGIACIILSLVTGQGRPFEHLGNSLPNPTAYQDGLSENDFDELTSTHKFTLEKSKTPGPVALIRCQIWTAGKEAVDPIETRLGEAVRHALWDLIMEYKVLTAPISDAMAEDVSCCSEPTTPMRVRRTGRSTIDHGMKMKEIISPISLYGSKEISTSVPDIAAKAQSPQIPCQNVGVFQFNVGPQLAKIEYSPEILHSKAPCESPTLPQNQDHTKSNLNYIFHSIIKSFLQFGSKLGCPALFSHICHLPSRHCVPIILSEIQNIMKLTDRDLNFKVFIRKTDVLTADTDFVPFTVNKDAAAAEVEELKPGTERSFIIVGRNIKQWKAYLGMSDFVNFQESHSDVLKSYQRFQTHTCSPSSPDKIQTSTPASPTSFGPSMTSSGISSPRMKSPGISGLDVSATQTPVSSVFVPRQRLLLIFIQDKELSLFLYNWSQEVTASFLKQITKLVEWHESRNALLNNLIVQKLGLFNGQEFPDHTDTEKTDKNELGRKHSSPKAPITWKVAEQLFQHHTSPREQPTAAGGVTRSASISSSSPNVQEILKNTRPPVVLNLCKYNSNRDPVRMFGMQIQDIRSVHKRGRDMQELRSMWQTRDTSFHNPYVDRLLLLLKRAARLSHYCLTPILFNPSWRLKVAPIRDHTVQPTELSIGNLDKSPSESSVSTNRSRHNSGGSLKNAEGTSSGASSSSRSRRASGVIPSSQSSPKIRIKNPSEETWHQTVCKHYLMEYMQYLQNLGYVSLQTKESPPNSGNRKAAGNSDSKQSKSTGAPIGKSNLWGPFHLIRYQLGGLLLFELGISDPYAYAYLFTVDCTRLHSENSTKALSSQFTPTFLDEIDKTKFMMHLHSFTYDYHLRTIHSYVSGRQLIFRHGYHLTSFLDDFIKYYQKSPNGARNLLHAGRITITDINMSGDQLYNYIISHNQLYGMTVLRMVPIIHESNMMMPTEFVLVELSARKASYKDYNDVCQMGSFDIGLLINHNTIDVGTDQNALILNYYIILTSQRDLFPKLENFGSTLGSFQTVRFAPSQTSSSFSSRKTSTVSLLTEKEKFESSGEETSTSSNESRSRRTTCAWGITDEEVTYLGYFSSQENMMQKVLLSEADMAHKHLTAVFGRAAVNCRRDYLWSALLPRSFKDEESASSHTSISYTEFTELLDLVSWMSLDDIDKGLSSFLDLHISWYKSLVSVLKTKYADCYREFTSPDQTVQYIVVTDVRCPDLFILLSIDYNTKRVEVNLVYREPPTDRISDKPNQRVIAMQCLIEEFVNACCFQLWSSMIV